MIATLGTSEASKVVTTDTSNNINLASNSYIIMPSQISDSSNANYLVNKEYVDSVAEGLHILEPCLVASYSNYVGTYTFSGSNNGVQVDLQLDKQVMVLVV